MAQRWAWTYRHQVSLFVASLVAVVVVGAALVTVLVLASGDGPGGAGGPGGTGAGGATTAAECVIGRWQVVEQQQQLSIGEFVLVDSSGPEVLLDADGSGRMEHGDGVDYFFDSILAGLGSGTVSISGPITFTYHIAADQMRYTDLESEATITNAGVSQRHQLSEKPFQFTCAGDTMTQQIGDEYWARLERRS